MNLTSNFQNSKWRIQDDGQKIKKLVLGCKMRSSNFNFNFNLDFKFAISDAKNLLDPILQLQN